MNDTLIIITTDHGGKGTGHGGSSTEEQTIFWAAKGKSIKPGTVLTDVENIDTAAVIVHTPRLDIPENCQKSLQDYFKINDKKSKVKAFIKCGWGIFCLYKNQSVYATKQEQIEINFLILICIYICIYSPHL